MVCLNQLLTDLLIDLSIGIDLTIDTSNHTFIYSSDLSISIALSPYIYCIYGIWSYVTNLDFPEIATRIPQYPKDSKECMVYFSAFTPWNYPTVGPTRKNTLSIWLYPPGNWHILGKRKIIDSEMSWDMLVPRRVIFNKIHTQISSL